jgi:hypothetical protein
VVEENSEAQLLMGGGDGNPSEGKEYENDIND